MRRGRYVRWAHVGVGLALMLAGSAAPEVLAEAPAAPQFAAQAAQGSGFTYQGRLTQDGASVDGVCDMQFGLWDSETDGAQVGATQTVPNESVADGLFTVTLNAGGEFGADAFKGEARWLALAVRCPAGSGDYTGLAPRQPITAAPYALSLMPGATLESDADVATMLVVKSTQTAGAPRGGILGQMNAGGGYGVKGESLLSIGGGVGVWGTAASDSGMGVYGENTHLNGGTGVWGYAPGGTGVFGSGGSNGVRGFTVQPTGAGVSGQALHATGVNYGVRGQSTSLNGYAGHFTNLADTGGVGVYAEAEGEDGYAGYFVNSSSDGGTAVYAQGAGAGSTVAALRAHNTHAQGVSAYFTAASSLSTAHVQNTGTGQVLWLVNGGTDGNGTNGGDFITAVNRAATTDTQFRVLTSGEVRSDVGFNTPAADFAEMLPAVPGLEPGDVLVIGPDGRLTRSSSVYQSSVAGVYSTQPGFVGGQPVEGGLEGHVPLAVVGVVPVKVTAEGGAIAPGDLLTTSSLPGHAMRAAPVLVDGVSLYPSGVVLGKALEGWEAGEGVIRMLVIVQ